MARHLPRKKQPVWQRPAEDRKRQKRKSAIRFWGIIAILLLLCGLTFKSIQILRGSFWDGTSRINFAIAGGEQVALASFGPWEKELIFLIIPKGTQIEVIHGYGKYRVESIATLEKLEKRRGLLAESLQENLGVSVGGWIKMEDRDWKMEVGKEELLGELQEQILGSGETSLSKWDLTRLWWQVRKIRFDQVKNIDLGKISVLTSVRLADQTQVWEIDKASLDFRIQKLFTESRIREENLGVEVLNGTSHPGLGERGARLITSFGAEVILVGNNEEKRENCSIRSATSLKNSLTIEKIGKIWGCRWEEKKEEGRAEITVILGEDYWQKLNQK